MLGGRLPETENKRICQISGLKSGRGRFRNLSGGRLRESSGNSIFFFFRTNTYTTYNTNILLTYIYIALLILTVFIEASKTNTYTAYNTSIIIFCINNFCFFTYKSLPLLTRLYLHHLH